MHGLPLGLLASVSGPTSSLDSALFSFQETEEPVVECQECDVDTSPSRTGGSSLVSGDLGDISSFSSKASGLQRSSSGGSSGLSVMPGAANSGRRVGLLRAGAGRGAESGSSALPGAKKLRCAGSRGEDGRVPWCWLGFATNHLPYFLRWLLENLQERPFGVHWLHFGIFDSGETELFNKHIYDASLAFGGYFCLKMGFLLFVS